MPHLAEFLSLVMRDQCPQVLETRVYRLHSAPLIGVGDFPAHSLLVFHCGTHLGRPMANYDGCESGRRRIHTFLGRIRQATCRKTHKGNKKNT